MAGKTLIALSICIIDSTLYSRPILQIQLTTIWIKRRCLCMKIVKLPRTPRTPKTATSFLLKPTDSPRLLPFGTVTTTPYWKSRCSLLLWKHWKWLSSEYNVNNGRWFRFDHCVQSAKKRTENYSRSDWWCTRNLSTSWPSRRAG